MLTISDRHMTAFEADAEKKRRTDFHDWWMAHAAVLGPIDRATSGPLFDHYEKQALIDGVDRDDRLYIYIAAFRFMPDMGGHQFIAMMDVVFLDADMVDDAGKLHRLMQIARTVPGDG